jgi:transposase
MQIPGVDWVVAAGGDRRDRWDMGVFFSVPSPGRLGGAVCPGNHKSAGKQTSEPTRRGNVHFRTILVGAAISASRTRGS